MIRPPDALQRCRILLGLRLRLLFRARTAKPVAFVATLFVNVMLLGFAVLMGLGAALGVSRAPETAESLVGNAFGSIFLAQCVLTLVGMAVSEFFDVGRIMHLPVAAKEVFAAMALSGLISIMSPLYAATPLGVAFACDGSLPMLGARVLCVLAVLVLGHLTALALYLVMTTAMSRRRMRDLAVVLGGLIGIGAYIGFRVLDMNYLDAGRGMELLHMRVPAFYAWLPTAGLTDLFWGRFEGYAPLRIGVTLLTGLLALRIGTSRLQLMLDGEAEPPTGATAVQSTDAAASASRFLPVATAASMSLHRRLMWRDPQLRMQWFQQVVFICLPWVFMYLGIEREKSTPSPWFLWLFPAMFALARATFHHGLFGADARGMTMLLLSPAQRTQLIAGRMLAVLSLCIPIDFVLMALLLLVFGAMQGDPALLLPLWPQLAFGIAIFHALAVSVGAYFSVRWPYPLATADRKRMAQSGQGQGCVTTLIKLFCFLPEFVLSGLLTLLALAPLMDLPWVGRLLPAWAALITIPAILAVCAVLAFAGCTLAARMLEAREEEFLQALRVTGD